MEENKALSTRDDSLPFKLMDALDDSLIIAELEGRMPDILTYHFQDKGQEVWGLSKAGVDEATCELAMQGEVIRELDLTFVDGEKEAYFTVKAGRYIVNKDGKEILLDTKFGTKRQPKKTVRGNDNTFWYEQGSIKACRNASMRLIPKTIVQAVIENAKKKGKVKEVYGEIKAEDSTSTPEKLEGRLQPPPSPPLIDPEVSANYLKEVIKHLDGYENLFQLRNGFKKHFHEWSDNLTPEDMQNVIVMKDAMKNKFEKGK